MEFWVQLKIDLGRVPADSGHKNGRVRSAPAQYVCDRQAPTGHGDSRLSPCFGDGWVRYKAKDATKTTVSQRSSLPSMAVANGKETMEEVFFADKGWVFGGRPWSLVGGGVGAASLRPWSCSCCCMAVLEAAAFSESGISSTASRLPFLLWGLTMSAAMAGSSASSTSSSVVLVIHLKLGISMHFFFFF